MLRIISAATVPKLNNLEINALNFGMTADPPDGSRNMVINI